MRPLRLLTINGNQGIIVGIATRYELDGRGVFFKFRMSAYLNVYWQIKQKMQVIKNCLGCNVINARFLIVQNATQGRVGMLLREDMVVIHFNIMPDALSTTA